MTGPVERIVIQVEGGPWSQAEAFELGDQLIDLIRAHEGVDSVRVQLGNSDPEGDAS